MQIHLIEARQEHYNGILPIFREVAEYHQKNAPWKFKNPKVYFSEDYFSSLLEDQKCKFIVAIKDDEIIGFVIAFQKQHPKLPILKKRTWVDIDNIAVKVGYKNQGIGNILIQKIEEWAKEMNIREIELNVFEFNTSAIEFYKHHDFKIYSHRMRKVL